MCFELGWCFRWLLDEFGVGWTGSGGEIFGSG